MKYDRHYFISISTSDTYNVYFDLEFISLIFVKIVWIKSKKNYLCAVFKEYKLTRSG